jgi:hypothetical protein
VTEQRGPELQNVTDYVCCVPGVSEIEDCRRDTDGGWSPMRYEAVYIVVIADVSKKRAAHIPRLQ